MNNIKLSFILLILAIIIGFSFYNNDIKEQQPQVETIKWTEGPIVGKLTGQSIHVIVIDSCEYLVVSGGIRESLTHKGNCKFCEERHKRNQK